MMLVLRWVAFVALVSAACAGTPRHAEPQRDPVEDHRQAGDAAFERGDFVEAAAHYDAMLARGLDAVPHEILDRRAAAYFSQREYDAGLAFIDRAVRVVDDPRELYEYRALIAWELGRRDEAVADAGRAVVGRPYAYRVLLLIGTYYADRDPMRAAAALTAYFVHRPNGATGDDGAIRVRLGNIYLAEGNPRGAWQQFALASKAAPDDAAVAAGVANGMCEVYVATHKYGDAIVLCQRIADDPALLGDDGAAVYFAGRAYLASKRPRDALGAALRYVEFDPGPAQGWLLLSDIYITLRRCDESTQALAEAAGRGADGAMVADRRKALEGCEWGRASGADE